MIELELKARVPDAAALVRHLESAGATLQFSGDMTDRRFDLPDRTLSARNEVLRVRIRKSTGEVEASMDWKGPTRVEAGYKRREEIGSIVDPDAILAILDHLGLVVVHRIDRRVRQYMVAGATVRLEQYPQMDDLVEVEGAGDAIERAISLVGIPRAEFTAESLAEFMTRYTARTGKPAIVGEAVT